MVKSRKKKNKLVTRCILAILLGTFVLLFLHNRHQNSKNREEFGLELAIPQFTSPASSEIIEHTGYTLSYNTVRKNANWVAYELTAEEVNGKEPRDNGFVPDPSIKGNQATDDDYRRSGWDRGHLAPAADMKWSKEAMEESFYLSNVSPQNSNLNRGVWKSIEELVRKNAKEHGKLLVVTGPVFTSLKGLGSIGKNKVMIPNGFYKVILAYDNGYHGIGFYCENKSGKKEPGRYALTIDEVEELTGIDFFYRLPDEVEKEVEGLFTESTWGL
jgi:endonuclease G